MDVLKGRDQISHKNIYETTDEIYVYYMFQRDLAFRGNTRGEGQEEY